MAKQNINVGTAANDKKGDSLRAAFQKVNANFTELYEAVGLAAAADQDTTLTFLGSTISTDDSSGIVIDRVTTVSSNLNVGGNIIPQTANGGDLGSSTLPWRSLYVSNNTIYIGGVPLGIDANGNLTVNGSQIAGGGGGGSTLVNGANTLSLGSDGVLTLPGGRIRIGATVDSDAIIANEDEAFGVLAQGTNGAVQLVWVEDLENAYTSNLAAVYVNSGGPGSVRIATGANSGPGPNYWEFDNSGTLTFPQGTTIGTADGGEFLILGAVDKDVYIYTYSGETARGWIFGTDGSLQIPGDIKSNGNINIDINLADSTLRRWQFGEDGDLVFPDGTVQNTAWTGSTTVSSLVNGSKTVSLDSSLGNLTFTNGEQIRTNVGGIQLYQSDDNTITILPGEARIKTFVAGGAKYEWDFDSTGRTTFPNGTVPEHSYGAAGDKEGMVVFTDPYIYYCKQDYVNNTTDIWVRVAWTGTSW